MARFCAFYVLFLQTAVI